MTVCQAPRAPPVFAPGSLACRPSVLPSCDPRFTVDPLLLPVAQPMLRAGGSMHSSTTHAKGWGLDRAIRRGSGFFLTTAIVAIALAVVAFAPSLINQTSRRGSVTPLMLAHAVFMSAWLALFLAQTVLAGTGRVRAHRRLGIAAIVIAAAIVVTGYAVTVAMVRRGFDLSGDLSQAPGGAPGAAVFQFSNITIFAVLVATALLFRRRPEIHKRLMTFAVIQTLMIAPLGHLAGHFNLPPLIFPAWGGAVLIAFLLHDWRTRGRIHPITPLVGVTLIVLGNVEAAVIGPSEWWQRFLAGIAH